MLAFVTNPVQTERFVLPAPLQMTMSQEPKALQEPDLQTQLKLVRKLHRLSGISWSPTLRANAEALKERAGQLELAASAKLRKKSS